MLLGKDKTQYLTARCLFCRTGYERETADMADGIAGVKALIPTTVKRFKEKGQWREEQKLLFPGYLFAFCDAEIDRQTFEKIDGVMRMLCYDGVEDGVLEGKDAEFARTLWLLNGKIGVMKAARIGDRVQITDGVFKSLEGRVVAMDRRKMAAHVELSVVGSILRCWLSYEIIETLDEEKYEKIKVDE